MKTLLTLALLLTSSFAFSNSITVKEVNTNKTFTVKVKDVTKYNFVNTYKVNGKSVKVISVSF